MILRMTGKNKSRARYFRRNHGLRCPLRLLRIWHLIPAPFNPPNGGDRPAVTGGLGLFEGRFKPIPKPHRDLAHEPSRCQSCSTQEFHPDICTYTDLRHTPYHALMAQGLEAIATVPLPAQQAQGYLWLGCQSQTLPQINTLEALRPPLQLALGILAQQNRIVNCQQYQQASGKFSSSLMKFRTHKNYFRPPVPNSKQFSASSREVSFYSNRQIPSVNDRNLIRRILWSSSLAGLSCRPNGRSRTVNSVRWLGKKRLWCG